MCVMGDVCDVQISTVSSFCDFLLFGQFSIYCGRGCLLLVVKGRLGDAGVEFSVREKHALPFSEVVTCVEPHAALGVAKVVDAVRHPRVHAVDGGAHPIVDERGRRGLRRLHERLHERLDGSGLDDGRLRRLRGLGRSLLRVLSRFCRRLLLVLDALLFRLLELLDALRFGLFRILDRLRRRLLLVLDALRFRHLESLLRRGLANNRLRRRCGA